MLRPYAKSSRPSCNVWSATLLTLRLPYSVENDPITTNQSDFVSLLRTESILTCMAMLGIRQVVEVLCFAVKRRSVFVMYFWLLYGYSTMSILIIEILFEINKERTQLYNKIYSIGGGCSSTISIIEIDKRSIGISVLSTTLRCRTVEDTL